MKKFEVRSLLVMLLALAMVLTLAACRGRGDDTTAPVDDGPEPAVTDPPETDPPETDPPEVPNPPETDPPAETDPDETDPPKYDPIETDPPATEPVETDPPETDPPADDHVHVYAPQITAMPSCTAEGERAMVCSICGDAKDPEVIEASGHSHAHVEREIVSLTHHSAIVDYCANCGNVAGVVEFTGAHDFTTLVLVADHVTDAGARSYGYEVFKCGGCDYILTVSANAEDGHYYVADEGSGKLSCMCGAVPTDKTTDNGNENAGPQLFPQG